MYGFVVMAWLVLGYETNAIPFASMESCEIAREELVKRNLNYWGVDISRSSAFCLPTGATPGQE